MLNHRNILISLFATMTLLLASAVVFADSDSDSIPIDLDGASGTLSVSVTRSDANHASSTHSIYVSADDSDVEGEWGGNLVSWNNGSHSGEAPWYNDSENGSSIYVESGNTYSPSSLTCYNTDPDGFGWIGLSLIIARTWAELESDSDTFDDWVNAELD